MKVFFSYHSTDRDLARYLAQCLAKGGYEVWDAEQHLLPGDNWPLKIGEALEDCQAMVVLVSPESMQSSQVRQEIDYALVSANYAWRLIPVLVRPTEEIPWILRKLPLIQATKSRAEVGKQVLEQLEGMRELAGS